MKKSKISIFVATMAIVALMLSSCATSVSRKVLRPADLDLEGATSISVLPFDITEDTTIGHSFFGFITITQSNPEEEELAAFIQNEISESIIDADYFTVISGKQTMKALEQGKTPACDVYIAGALTGYKVDTKSEKTDKVDKNGAVIYNYRKTVSFNMSYEVINAKTGKVYYSESNSYSNYRTTQDFKSLPSATEIMRYSFSNVTSKLIKQLKPYEYTIYRELLEDETKNADMKLAAKYAKDRNYIEARELYEKIYTETGMFEAGYNVAILVEMMGDFETARSILNSLYRESFDIRCSREIANIDREIEYQRRLSKQTSQRGEY